MAFSLIAGMKLLQVSVFYQAPKKDKIAFKKQDKEKIENASESNSTEVINKATSDEKIDDTLKETDVEEITQEFDTNSSASNEYLTLEDLKENYISIKNAALEDGRSREDVVIRYYKHEKDGDKVYALKNLRYYLHEKPATETKGLGSNVMYYGDEVNKEDIQVVAFILLENGIPLKSIERSKYDWKSNAIEIGTDSLLIGQKNLTKNDISDL